MPAGFETTLGSRGDRTAANVAAFVGAAAALAAALFSGVSLYLAGKREERRWRRDALVSAYQRFIELSFERSLNAVEGMDLRRNGEPFDLKKLRRDEWRSHEEYDGLLTRMRLLGAGAVVQAAEPLHGCDQELIKLGLGTDEAASDADFDFFEEKREQDRKAKLDMLHAARATLGLEPAAPIAEQIWAR